MYCGDLLVTMFKHTETTDCDSLSLLQIRCGWGLLINHIYSVTTVNILFISCTVTLLYAWVGLHPRRRLRSSSKAYYTSALVGPRTPRVTISDRAFPAAEASVQNSLPESVRASLSLTVFRSHRRRSSVNFRGSRHVCPKNMYEKLTKCPNFTRFLPEN